MPAKRAFSSSGQPGRSHGPHVSEVLEPAIRQRNVVIVADSHTLQRAESGTTAYPVQVVAPAATVRYRRSGRTRRPARPKQPSDALAPTTIELRRSRKHTKRSAPKLGVGEVTWETRILESYAGIMADGTDLNSYRFSHSLGHRRWRAPCIAKESCRTIPRAKGDTSLPLRNARSVSAHVSLPLSAMHDATAQTLHVNFRANGFGAVPGIVPGGISGKVTVSRTVRVAA